MRRTLLAVSALAVASNGCFPSFDDIPPTSLDGGTADAGDAGADSGVSDGGAQLHVRALARGIAATHTCALMEDRSVECWGDNATGELGTTERASLRPAIVPGLSNVDEVAVGFEHTCAISGGRVHCFGRNDAGQLGRGTMTPFERDAAPIDSITGAVRVAAGVTHSCALTAIGDVYCWGETRTGTRTSTPARAALPGAASAIGAGAHASAAIVDGAIYVWGSNDCARLGFIQEMEIVDPVLLDIDPTLRFVDVDLADIHGCARTSGDRVYCWGCNGAGMAGDLPDPSTPALVLEGAKFLDAGFRTTCAVLEDGTAQCWGGGYYGMRGDGLPLPGSDSRLPTGVIGLLGADELAVYWEHACARSGGELRCWGRNHLGMVGDGSQNDTPYPIRVLP